MKKLLITTLMVGALVGSVFAQGTVSLPLGSTYKADYSPNGVTITAVPVGNPAQVSTYGNLNIQVYYAANNTAAPFGSAFSTASLMPSAWSESSTSPIQQILGLAGITPSTTFTLPNATGGANAEVMVVGWTGTYTDWDDAYNAWKASPTTVLLGWTGEALSGGALAWSNGTGAPNASPPTFPVALTTGATGYNGLVLTTTIVPEPSTFALAGLGAAALLIFRRRK